jgi:hypothetical protein
MIDFLATSPHYEDHLAPIRAALPERARGEMLHDRPRGDRRPTVCSASRDTRTVIRSGRPVAVTEHGYGQSYSTSHNQSYPGGHGLGAVGLFLAPNEHAADRWRTEYPKARVEVVGCPKLDTLPMRVPGPGPVIALSFHWGCTVAPEAKGAWDFYKRAIPDLALRYQVLGHGHPRLMGTIAGTYRRLGVEVVDDFADVCRRADLYVCDNSSTIYEFASTGRPVVVLNAPWYRRSANHGLRFWDAASVGVQCDDPDDLPAVIEEALADHPEQQAAREAALDLVYSVRRGASQRAADVLLDWAEGVAA